MNLYGWGMAKRQIVSQVWTGGAEYGSSVDKMLVISYREILECGANQKIWFGISGVEV